MKTHTTNRTRVLGRWARFLGVSLRVGLMAALMAPTAAVSQSLTPVPLGSTANFAVLASATVTNTGLTKLTGNLGVSPGNAVTGFPPGTITGSIHAGNPTSAQAQADLTTAFNDAAGRTGGAAVSGNLGGLTLTPGLYKSTSSLEISSGNLTLDAQGNANAVFIFQMASTLTTTVGRQVILSGGAKSSNIFWQVGSSATLGTNSVFKGNLLAAQSITLNTGAALDGRALARIGAVTLDANTVSSAGPTAVEERKGVGTPSRFVLKDAYPNPFNPSTIIEFEIPQATHAQLEIYNSAGQRVKTLVDQPLAPGFYRSVWDATNKVGSRVSSGVYFYRLDAGSFASIKKVILIK